MSKAVWGIVLSFALVFAVLGVSGVLKKRGCLGAEASRKLTHILLSNWILLALFFFETPLAACVVPASFVVLNAISYRKGIFTGIEREQDNTPGTVWFAVSLLVLCFVCYRIGTPWIAACGVLSMGYGDGLAALVGGRFGGHRFGYPLESKSIEGTLAAFAFSALAVGFVCAAYAPDADWSIAPVCGVLAAALELCSPRGLDNLTLPLGVAATVYLIVYHPETTPIFVCLAVTLCILIASFALRAVTFGGMLSAVPLGVLLYAFSGLAGYAALLLFFVFGSAVSKSGRVRKSKASSLHRRQGARGPAQVAANGAPALIFAALYHFTAQSAYLPAVLACFSAAAADTFSSEIGLLSGKTPVSILTLKPVRKGLSGGVTWLGLAGGVLGGILLSLPALPVLGIPGMAAIWLLGVAGSLLDSVLGASLQVKYRLPQGAGLTELPVLDGTNLTPDSGITWINNDTVNFASQILTGVLCVLLMSQR